MRVWLITIGEPLPTDGNGGDRLYRAGILATMLAQNGHDVVWWSSTFDHVRKQQRFSTDTMLRLQSGVLLKLLHGCGYARNVSLRRLVDHAVLARKFTSQAEGMPRPDVILCSLPPLELPVAVTRYGKTHSVPVIVDVRDLWPDLFVEFVPRWVQPLFNLALAPMWRQVRTACRNAYAITGNAPQFVEWGLALASRTGAALDRAFSHGYAARTPAPAKVEEARAYWQNHGIRSDSGIFVACFFGAIGPQSELDTVINAARELEEQGKKFKFVLCGKGDHLETLKRKAENVSSVIFSGWVNAAEIWTLMQMSQVGLAVYRSNVGYVTNLPNKPIEYFSAGLPVVSSLKGYLEHFLADHGCGLTYPNGDAEALARVLTDLDDDRSRLEVMSGNARRVFSEKFDADKVYGEMMAYLQDVVAAYPAQSHSQEEI
jgi:glycosyltransferase involved in cell wall biosynthesis